jgi:RNA polymerase sigma-70 factor (ECF subfamily)
MTVKRESRRIFEPADAESEAALLSDREEPDDAGQPEAAVSEHGRVQSPQADWSGLVARIQAGDGLAMEELYQIFSRGIRFHLCRQLGPQELDDKVHDTFLIVVQAIQRGELREPERLMGFVRTIVRRQIAAYIEELVQNRRQNGGDDVDDRIPDSRRNPEQNIAFRQKIELMKSILRGLGDRDREILTRFYIHEQTQEQICQDLALTDTQFRLLKSRAKARFGALGRRKLQRSNLMNLFLRVSSRG